MAKVTVATFNCENLFQRYRFSDNLKESKKNYAIENGFILDIEFFEKIKEPARELTAKAIKETKADIIGLQEVENLDTLKSFQTAFLGGYPYKYLIDGNDNRLIDVGVLSKFEATYLKTHQYDRKGKSEIFSRDCLEVEYNINGTPVTIFVNHFKSMLVIGMSPEEGRAETMAKRELQSVRVVEIIKNKFGNNPGKENFIVLGDLNDYLPSQGLDPLLKQTWIENVIKTRIPDGENWTHWFDKKKTVSQLDYILVSKKLAEANKKAAPVIVRKGLALNATQYAGPRFPGVGKTQPVASDHCPVAITLNI